MGRALIMIDKANGYRLVCIICDLLVYNYLMYLYCCSLTMETANYMIKNYQVNQEESSAKKHVPEPVPPVIHTDTELSYMNSYDIIERYG